jgi:hypothetical protein
LNFISSDLLHILCNVNIAGFSKNLILVLTEKNGSTLAYQDAMVHVG